MKLTWTAVSMLALSLVVIPPSRAKASGTLEGVEGVPAAAQDHGRWDMPPEEFRDVQRQGFHDGVEGARKDFDNHRRPDVTNREEFRHPHVRESERADYREGFRRGYQEAVEHLYGHHY